jgi:hypothetical protein
VPPAVFAASQRSPTAMPGAARMIRMLGAIVGAAGKLDMLVNRPLAVPRAGALPHCAGPPDRSCRELPRKGVELEPGFGDLSDRGFGRARPCV